MKRFMTKNFTSEYHNISKSLIENSKFLKSIETSLKFYTDVVYRNSCLIHVIEYVGEMPSERSLLS